ncbi:MAG: hypothetical protein Q9164_005763 [Protoblastenia rupestris]
MTCDVYRSPDKDSGYATQPDDLCNDLFDLDEYLSRDSSQHIIDPAGSDGFEPFDFNFDFDEDTTASESYSGDSKCYNNGCPERPSPSSGCSAPPQRSSALRPHRVLPRSNHVNPSISGGELLSIEGKFHSNGRPRSPPHTYSATPDLRRKGKFCTPTDTRRGISQRVSRKLSNDTMQPSHYYEHDMSSYHEWTQRFGQISLQQAEAIRELSPSPKSRFMQTENVRSPYHQPPLSSVGHRKTVSEQVVPRHRLQARQATGNMSHDSGQYIATQAPVQAGATSDSYPLRTSIGGQADSSPRHSRQPASWSQPHAEFHHHDYTISPSQLHTNWEHTLQENPESYFSNAAQSAAVPNYPPPDFLTPYDTFGHINGADSQGYQIDGLPRPQQSCQVQCGIGSYTNEQNMMANQSRPETPPFRTTATTPPPQDPPQSSKHSRSSKRKSRIGPLRLPKSVGNLKCIRSSRDLRSPKSAGALKSSKSTVGLKSPGEFGFVNFTPSDSGRILTGVAPSGSSKTKARREQEANEKKRRLSMAAERAIREAGGDPEKLRREGLL